MLLSMTGVNKSFGDVRVLTDASLQVEPGEVMALIGQNGAIELVCHTKEAGLLLSR